MAFLDCQDGRRPVVMPERTSRHPCFSATACLQYARMHLPVAPRCNIACNYCNRKYDCAHESRPGVTSGVLSPAGALERFLLLRGRLENLSVVGIAGPGDALANWESTRQTIELIKMHAPELIFCLSTNGLLLPDYAASLTGLGVDHVTVTVNCLDPAIGEKIYRYVHYRGKRYTGREGAALLIANQLAGIAELSGRGVVVKVNIVLIKGINEGHIPEVVRKMRDLGAYISNIMPMIPARGSAFAALPGPDPQELKRLRDACRADLPQMYHCRQCRADAVGRLDEDRLAELPITGRPVALAGYAAKSGSAGCR